MYKYRRLLKFTLLSHYSYVRRSGGLVVDNTLDYQSKDRKIDPPLPRSFG